MIIPAAWAFERHLSYEVGMSVHAHALGARSPLNDDPAFPAHVTTEQEARPNWFLAPVER